MDNISFKSRIKLVQTEDFARLTKNKNMKSVNYPWTIKESVKAPNVLTTDIYDCTALGIVSKDDNNVLLMHISPNGTDYKKINKIETFISKKINLLSDNLTGFIIGSKKNNINSPTSTKMFDKLAGILDKYNISYTKFKGGNYSNNIAYSSKDDTWLVANDVVDLSKSVYNKNKKQILNFMFDEIKTAPNDNIEI